MSKRLAFAITAGLVLSSCSHESGCYLPHTNTPLTSWDGLGSDPTAKDAKPPKARQSTRAHAVESTAPEAPPPEEAALAGLKPYSAEWWSVRDSIDRAAEDKLAKRLIICRDCMPTKPNDLTGSITSH
jgi:hypothetical protein